MGQRLGIQQIKVYLWFIWFQENEQRISETCQLFFFFWRRGCLPAMEKETGVHIKILECTFESKADQLKSLATNLASMG